MALVGFVASTLSEMETFNIAYVLIATGGFTLVYLVKNAIMPSVSIIGVDMKDIISGAILALGMALSSYAAQVLTIGFDWQTLLVSVSGAVLGYFTKTIPHKGDKGS